MREELLELTRLGGLNLREEVRGASGRAVKRAQACLLLRQVFDVLLDLTRLDVVPTAVSQARHHGTGSSTGLTLPARC